MEDLKFILKQYGINGEYTGDPQYKFPFSLEFVNGRISKRKTETEVFHKALGHFQHLYIENVELFSNKFGLEQICDKRFYPVLEKARLRLRPIESNFELVLARENSLQREIHPMNHKKAIPIYTLVEKEEIAKWLMPEYPLQKVFNKHRADEDLSKKIEMKENQLKYEVTRIDMKEFKNKLFELTISNAKKAMEKFEFREENKTKKNLS